MSAPVPTPQPRKRGVPLRFSLVALTLALVVVGLLASGVAVTSSMRQDLISRADEGLVNATRTWAEPRSPADEPRSGPPGPRRPPSPYYVESILRGPDGISAVSVYNQFDHAPDLDRLTGDNAGPVTVGSVDPHGPQWRVIKRSNRFGTSIVATPMSDIDATVSRLIWLQSAIGAVVVVLIGVLSYLLVRTSLRPLRRVEETAQAIAEGDLTRRVPLAAPNTEVGSLSDSLNTMLGQIQQAFVTTAASERQARASEEEMRRFIADASHELRTPLTSIKGFAELYSQGGVPDVTDAMRRIDDEAGRMNLLVEDLLMLARLDAQRPLATAPVDLLSLAADAVQSARVAAPDRNIRLEVTTGDQPPVVSGDAPKLLQVLRNLIGNAVNHTPDDASITVGLAVEAAPGGGSEVVLTVADTGPGLAPEDADHVFERFYRGDQSRYRGSGGGSGLGLSIVAALVEAHGGRVGVESTPGEGATFWVRLPLLAE
ncbi:sensor histidine kinase [Gordonia amicalis]|uniref:histidine kinase n=1 Tax=Gordonia amicalis TaxID=89053 RepID=A0ABU4DH70_9ACTN|nr:HAMP domain-containing sensor histidine kinase [Gordonia amicalis]MCZ4650038.1 HAMP domain-containing sensor histidine kinase [Gordonia amicalis]MDV6308980.1 HAMP domain-containing sensor histidine kinase [Gordonia amicalis]NKX77731.1 HAMP domain-containing histidine kinase [Gordonia amicalis]UKO92994.1 HAMP domain-containing histidine kinase [Gordonia amicalis]UOG20689.1 HAMP domain-containing histidine kinase [Gordonia amicalis]